MYVIIIMVPDEIKGTCKLHALHSLVNMILGYLTNVVKYATNIKKQKSKTDVALKTKCMLKIQISFRLSC